MLNDMAAQCLRRRGGANHGLCRFIVLMASSQAVLHDNQSIMLVQ
jgi:hypothetical protein